MLMPLVAQVRDVVVLVLGEVWGRPPPGRGRRPKKSKKKTPNLPVWGKMGGVWVCVGGGSVEV